MGREGVESWQEVQHDRETEGYAWQRLQKHNYFSESVTTRTPQFLDSVALPASARPPTHERQFRGRVLMIRSHKSSMFWKPVILGPRTSRAQTLKLQASKT